MASITQRFKQFLLKIMKVSEYATRYTIHRQYSFQGNAAKNKLWYDGDAYELSQFYQQTDNAVGTFWGSTETAGQEIRRIHAGIPALIVDSLTNITANDLENITIDNEEKQKVWDETMPDNCITNTLAELTKTALIIGDGAAKFTYDLDNSKTPDIEIVPGDRVDLVYSRKRLVEIKFYTYYNVEGTDYTLEETYGYGFIKYKLYRGETEVSIKAIRQTSDLEDVTFDKNVMLAVPFKFFHSTKYTDRGKSIYEGKSDAFDALDECVSQWMDALRAGRTKTYIPDSLIPRDMDSGALMKSNPFDNRFIKIGTDMAEGARNQIDTKQPDIRVDAYLQTYIHMLEMSIQGIISPATLGIDTKKIVDPNAAYSREMEKCTLYTRSAIIQELTKITKKLIQAHFDTIAIMYNTPRVEIEANVSFGEYANPSFEAVVEVMSNPNTPMSIEARIEELWGDTKTEEWKAEEVKRIKNERGIVEMPMPSLGQQIPINV